MVMPVSLFAWWLDYNLLEDSSSNLNGFSSPCKSKVEECKVCGFKTHWVCVIVKKCFFLIKIFCVRKAEKGSILVT